MLPKPKSSDIIVRSYLNHALSLESLQISAVWPGPVRWTSEAGLRLTVRLGRLLQILGRPWPTQSLAGLVVCKHWARWKNVNISSALLGFYYLPSLTFVHSRVLLFSPGKLCLDSASTAQASVSIKAHWSRPTCLSLLGQAVLHCFWCWPSGADFCYIFNGSFREENCKLSSTKTIYSSSYCIQQGME